MEEGCQEDGLRGSGALACAMTPLPGCGVVS